MIVERRWSVPSPQNPPALVCPHRLCQRSIGTDAVKLRRFARDCVRIICDKPTLCFVDSPDHSFPRYHHLVGCPLLSEGEEMPKTITVTNMPRASHLADGSMVEMEFAG